VSWNHGDGGPTKAALPTLLPGCHVRRSQRRRRRLAKAEYFVGQQATTTIRSAIA